MNRYFLQIIPFIFVIALILAALPMSVSARDIKIYLKQLEQTVEDFKAFTDESVNFKDESIIKAADAVLKQSINLFPANEEIYYRDTKVPVDNTWIAKEASAFARETDPVQKKVIIVSIGERFQAIAVQVSGLEYLEGRSTTKDEEKQRLAGILSKEEYNPADAEAMSPAARLYMAIQQWIESLFPKMKPTDPKNNADLSGLKTGLQVLIFVLVVALLIYLIAKFGPQFMKRYRKESKTKRSRLILGEEIGPDATTANLFAEAEDLARSGDIRGAIRKGYISLLFELSERRMIGLAKHKTNRDYLRDLVKHREVRTSVGGLTVNYEKHWYGSQDAVEHDWSEFREGYHEALKR